MTWSVPNLITLFRMVLCFSLFVALYWVDDNIKIWIFIILAVVNNVLDVADGAIARRFNMVTASGKFFDAAGDRLIKTFLMCLLSHLGVFPWFLTAFHLGLKNQFFELPAFYVEGHLNDSKRIKAVLPLYYALTYYKPWIGAGVVLNYLIWGLLIYNHYNQPIFSVTGLTVLYGLFFLHSLVRAIPVISVYGFIDKRMCIDEGQS